jgi:hypothetical protein
MLELACAEPFTTAAALAQSTMNEIGLLHPIAVSPFPGMQTFMASAVRCRFNRGNLASLVCDQRRAQMRAAGQMKLKSPCCALLCMSRRLLWLIAM